MGRYVILIVWLCCAGCAVRGGENSSTGWTSVGTMEIDGRQGALVLLEAEETYHIALTVQYPLPERWRPKVQPHEVQVWVLTRQGGCLTLLKPPSGWDLNGNARVESASLGFTLRRDVDRESLAAIVTSIDGKAHTFPVPPP